MHIMSKRNAENILNIADVRGAGWVDETGGEVNLAKMKNHSSTVLRG